MAFGVNPSYNPYGVELYIHLVDGLSGVVGDVLAEKRADEENLLCLDLNVRRLKKKKGEQSINIDMHINKCKNLKLKKRSARMKGISLGWISMSDA